MPTTNRFDSTEPYPAGPGYDMATGLGTPNGGTLAASLCALAAPPAPAETDAGSGGQGAPAPQSAKARLLRASISGVTRQAEADLRHRRAHRRQAAQCRREPAAGAVRDEGSTRNPDLRIRLANPRPTARFKIAFPTLEATPSLIANVKKGRVQTRELLLATRESGGKGARLPAVPSLQPLR